jgi:hypothetical protein
MAHKPLASMRESNKTRSLLNGESKVSGEKYHLPKRAKLIYNIQGIDVNDNIITAVALECAGKRYPKHREYYVIQYREVNRKIDRSSRTVRQFSGIDALLRLDAEMVGVCRLLVDSRTMMPRMPGWIP